ncbi:T9SS-dependent choice-of-anchor J family protein [Flavobacterium aquidurense]|uniref:T9SS-dependent choice-of-anchor J family protein n=1 Tax=Flavobacterium aquidurense TaxID=362413 RepID=UPI00285AEAB2|nr:choice-of-anchor J domain-containing protein [Flavobacterium aquidurense]MDR7372092.1 endonuclease/exonuclease/phosphatase family metal-dependent hydrolase [Flavobacterium aquidurense]
MKNSYSVRHFLAFLSFFYCCSVSLFGQTNPTAQPLPYEQVFDEVSTLAHSSVTYPVGFQGWAASLTSPGTDYNINLLSDKALTPNSTASTSSGNIHNYKGKIGFLDTNNVDLAIGFAFSTTTLSQQQNIQVTYDAMLVRNPYDGNGNTRVSEMALQYRIGTSGNFITLPFSAYQSNTQLQTDSGNTTPVNSKKIKVKLPPVCDNQPVVQIRWIARQVSGAGARPSFAIDNIDIRSDIFAPVYETGFPKVDNISTNSFDFSSKLDEVAKTYYVLLPAGSATPSIAHIQAGVDANDVTALQAGFISITNPSQVYVNSFTGLNTNTAYSVFSVSEDAHGNLQTVVNKVDAITLNGALPTLSTAIASLDLGVSEATYPSEIKNYQIQGTNLTNDVVLTSTSSNFTISKDNNVFGSSITFTTAELAAAQTVYVRFTPNAVGNFSGGITHESVGATTKTLALSGIGIDPYKQGFNDVNVLTNSGWTQYDVAGSLNKWAQTIVTRNVNTGTGAVLANGYSDAGASKDWLISPRLRLNNFNNIPLLSFYSRKFYDGPGLKLMVSVDYDGKGNPENFNWTELNGKFPTNTGTYFKSEFIDLSAYKTDHTYVAWVYETTAGGSNNAAEWSLDDVLISNETSYVDSKPNLDFGDLNVGNVSASQPFIFKAVGYNDITLAVSTNFELSLDNITFQSSVIVSEAEAAAGKTIYARFVPSVKLPTISGTITSTGTSLNKQIGSVTGSSILKADTFDIVTYNLEFFGSNVIGSDGQEFGPTDDVLQVENVAKIMNKLNADVYVVQEVSDEPSLNSLISQISINGKKFDKTISTSWSYSFKDPDPKFPPQKLVVLYNTQTTTVKKTRVMFKDLYDQIRANTVTLANYPSADGDDSFFASGRLPYMVTIETNIGGIKKEINLIDLHARANSGADISKYNMRKYDAELLKDSLDVHYPNSNFMILGDFNDDVKSSVIAGNPSSYQKIVEDTNNYSALTLGISQAGAYSFLSSGGFLDHIVISNELSDQYIPNSVAVYDPRNDIANYTTTTSDHGPVIARFELKQDNLSTIDFENKNSYSVKVYPNPATDLVTIAVKTEENKKLKLKLYDIHGRLLRNAVEINSGEDKSTVEIPIGSLQSGIYIYTLTENNKVIYSNKIIKK